MATIKIETTAEEQQQVLAAIEKHVNEVIAVSKIAQTAKLNQNRVRFIIADLIDLNKVKRIPVKAFNARYIRYKYKLVED